MNIAMILSGGVGQRFGASTPKQYQEVLGKPVVKYVVDAALKARQVDKVLVVCAKEYFDWFKNEYEQIEVCEGGGERNVSLMNGLKHIKNNIDSNCEKVMIFDAMRPFVTPELIDEYFTLLKEYDVVATCQRIVDSLGCLDFKECDRSRYYLLQSPEAFRFEVLYNNFDPNSQLVEAYQQLPDGTTLYKYFDFRDNYKLTYESDLEIMKAYMMYKNSQE